MTDPLLGIVAFVTGADRASFTSAADELGMGRAAVGAQIRSLEAWLGVQLLHRSTRVVRLTEAGSGPKPPRMILLNVERLVSYHCQDHLSCSQKGQSAPLCNPREKRDLPRRQSTGHNGIEPQLFAKERSPAGLV